MSKDFLTPAQFGREASVAPRTVQHWCTRGRLPVEKGPEGTYQIPAAFVPLVQNKTLPLAQTKRRTISTW
jgi:hypothetical protein